MLEKLTFRFLMWLWVRSAIRLYGGLGECGELFSTAAFQQAVGKTTGQSIGEQASKVWLIEYGVFAGSGHWHWFRSQAKANENFKPCNSHEPQLNDK